MKSQMDGFLLLRRMHDAGQHRVLAGQKESPRGEDSCKLGNSFTLQTKLRKLQLQLLAKSKFLHTQL